MTERHIDRDC